MLALAATLVTLAALIGTKVTTRPGWRADTGASLRLCLQQAPTGTANRLPTTAHLAGCLAHRQPVRNDPIEALTLAVLAALTAAEIRYLSTH